MGATRQGSDDTTNKLELADWISKVKSKKCHNNSRQRKNLLMQAVLTHALEKAETELKQKWRQRKSKWHEVRSTLSPPNGPVVDPELDQTCQELIAGLEEFMSQMSQAKGVVVR